MKMVSIVRKVIMSLSGLGLVLFIIVHLVGNVQLLYADNGYAFNKYADFMGHNPAIQLSAWGIKAVILLHIVLAIILTRANKSARPVGYATPNHNSSWFSRNMLLLGVILMAFIAVHLANFWGKFHYGSDLPVATYENGESYIDLYHIVDQAFSQWWLVAFYVVSMIALSFHLVHGFSSAFQSIGMNHPKYNPIINYIGIAVSILIPIGFAVIPVAMFFNVLS